MNFSDLHHALRQGIGTQGAERGPARIVVRAQPLVLGMLGDQAIRSRAAVVSVARPWILRRMADHAGAHGIDHVDHADVAPADVLHHRADGARFAWSDEEMHMARNRAWRRPRPGISDKSGDPRD
ncbi:MAG TPA: hypothetical protein VGJ74_18045 [Burkholderiales bacterium]|jgi:hypothetical protein